MFLDEILKADDYAVVKGQLLRAINDNRGWYILKWKEYCKKYDGEILSKDYWFIKGKITGQYELLNDLSIVTWDTYSKLCDELRDEMDKIAKSYGKVI